MPFVTEELWQRLPGRGTMGESESIMMAPYPAEVGEEGKAWQAGVEVVEMRCGVPVRYDGGS